MPWPWSRQLFPKDKKAWEGFGGWRNLLVFKPKQQLMEAALFWKPGLEGTVKDSLIIWGHNKYRTRARNDLLS